MLFQQSNKDNDIFCKNFEFDIKTCSRGLPINPFMATKLRKINHDSIVVPELMFERIKSMEDVGLTQFQDFVNDCLIFEKLTSADIHTDNFKVWDFSVTDVEKNFAATNSIINKMRSASEHRLELAEIIFKYEIVDVAQSLASTSGTAYHGQNSYIMKRLPPFSQPYLTNKESNAAIIIEMSPVIPARCVSVTSDVDCFSNLAFAIFYHVQSLTSSFDIVDLVLDRCFEHSLKEDTSKDRGMGSRFVFTGNTKLSNKTTEDFLMNSASKNDFNEFLVKMFHHVYRGDQIYIISYRDSVLTNQPEQVSDEGFSTRKCQSEEAD